MQHDIYNGPFFTKISGGSRDSAGIVIPVVTSLLPACASVVDFGCGTGAWLREFGKHGIGLLRGLDFQRAGEGVFLLSPDEFMKADLGQYQSIGRFDLAMSLEVVEHLPRSSAETIVASLTDASDFVLFSAAVPDQGGDGHINEQWPSFWHRLFADRGFEVADILRPKIWSDDRISWWYRQNLFFYVNASACALPQHWASLCSFGGNDLVHPAAFAHRLRKIRSDRMAP